VRGLPWIRRTVVRWVLRVGSLLLALGATGAQALTHTGCATDDVTGPACLVDGQVVESQYDCRQCCDGCHDWLGHGWVCGRNPDLPPGP